MNDIRKYIFFIFVLSFFTFYKIDLVKADYSAQFVATGNCQLYDDNPTGNIKKSSGNCFYANTKFNSVVKGAFWIDSGDKFTVLTNHDKVPAPKTGYGSECDSDFSYIKFIYSGKTYNGYVCSSNIWTGTIPDEHATEFKEAGFPESYWQNLSMLKTSYPNWKFIAVDTELDFQTAVNNMNSGNKSLIQYTSSVNDLGYLSTDNGNYNWDTDRFTVYDGSSWYAANKETIAYYLDPRNFLTAMYLFQFELLQYDSNIHNLEGVKSLLGNSYIGKFSEHFMTAAEKTKVNPIYLAALSKQEVGDGSNAGTAINGKSFTYNGKTYSNLYNFYNIGATSGSNAVYRGLVYANGGEDGSSKTYDRPWNSEEKAIIGGAKWIESGYISSGQNTSYFKKWNTVYNYSIKKGITTARANYTHQYMQNIQAPRSEAVSSFRAYSNSDLLKEDLVFYIPVYRNMPPSTSLPKKGNPNNRLKSISINGDNIKGYESDVFDYIVYVDHDIVTADIVTTKINSNASVSGDGKKTLSVGDNKYTLTVTAQNGNKQTYSINIVRAEDDNEITYPSVEDILTNANIVNDGTYISNLTLTTKVSDFTNKILETSNTAKVEIKTGNNIKNNGYLYTGDTVTITSGTDIKTYSIVIYGDVNGDGTINALDLLKVQKHILKTSSLTGAYQKSADVNKDGTINALDLLRVQKHILGDTFISQK